MKVHPHIRIIRNENRVACEPRVQVITADNPVQHASLTRPMNHGQLPIHLGTGTKKPGHLAVPGFSSAVQCANQPISGWQA